MRAFPRPASRGFSLIELMVAVVIAGILAAVAYPAYTSFVLRSRRADAIAVLTAIVQAQERYRTNRNEYASSADTLNVNVQGISKYYTLSIAGVGATPSLTAGYLATASVVSTSAQQNDTACTKLAVELKGAELKYLAASGTSDLVSNSACWAR